MWWRGRGTIFGSFVNVALGLGVPDVEVEHLVGPRVGSQAPPLRGPRPWVHVGQGHHRRALAGQRGAVTPSILSSGVYFLYKKISWFHIVFVGPVCGRRQATADMSMNR